MLSKLIKTTEFETTFNGLIVQIDYHHALAYFITVINSKTKYECRISVAASNDNIVSLKELLNSEFNGIYFTKFASTSSWDIYLWENNLSYLGLTLDVFEVNSNGKLSCFSEFQSNQKHGIEFNWKVFFTIARYNKGETFYSLFFDSDSNNTLESIIKKDLYLHAK